MQLSLHNSGVGPSVLSSTFLGSSLKKVSSGYSESRFSLRSFKVVAEIDDKKQTDKDRWKGLAFDISDDQQDITRGKGMVDPLFQAPMGAGTHDPIMSSYDYISTALRQYNLDNNMNGFYIAPAFMDKLVVHITKNFMDLPNIKVPLILGIWGGKGQGKSFQCELVFAKIGINPIMMRAGELERAVRLGGTTQYTVNSQMVNATLMNIADNPTNVQLPGMYNKEENPRVRIIVTDNVPHKILARLLIPSLANQLVRKWIASVGIETVGKKLVNSKEGPPTFEQPKMTVEKLFEYGQMLVQEQENVKRVQLADKYLSEVRKWIASVGIETVGKKLVNSKEGPPTFEQPKMTVEKLFEYGQMLVQEQENVKRVQLADKYLSEVALGEANEDAIENGYFNG
ncbi:hypothetical protein IFM89_001501 [Coptis chinensis]|uniref:Ribulose bisphosphate carboxylase/oxygenase activase AAA helical domain-containing protein n=1 Tax=Coptis chinensis TaxID=261450 RepID=A0A835LHD7_9MAGN|nr:hypothetical protein IFM89_001501 [Coptis chinensis]